MGRVTVDRERCKGCGYCIPVCRRELMRVDPADLNSSGYPVAVFGGQEERCTGCALCAEVCPEAALEVYTEKAARKAAG